MANHKKARITSGFFDSGLLRPGQNRNGRHRILRTPLDYPIAVDQINQGIALLIEEPHDLHGFEYQRGTLTKHLLALLELLEKADRPNLATGNRRLGAILSLSLLTKVLPVRVHKVFGYWANVLPA